MTVASKNPLHLVSMEQCSVKIRLGHFLAYLVWSGKKVDFGLKAPMDPKGGF